MEAFNILLDALPDNYEGYLIRTDYRIGVQIALISNDDTLTDSEKVATALSLLYGAGVPKDLRLALQGVKWFMKGGEAAEQTQDGEEADSDEEQAGEVFDFDYDAMRLCTAFRKAYGIDLNKARLHWFEFRGLIVDLGECAFSTIVGYRAKDLNGLSPKQRSEYAKLKRKYALPHRLSDDDEAKISEFLAAMTTANSRE